MSCRAPQAWHGTCSSYNGVHGHCGTMDVLCGVLWVPCFAHAAVVPALDIRLDAKLVHETQRVFVVDTLLPCSLLQPWFYEA